MGENERLIGRTRTITCVWCGENLMCVDKGTAPESLLKQMKEHALHCPSNPLYTANKRLKEKINLAIGGIDALCLMTDKNPTYEDFQAVKQTLEGE